MLHEDEKSIDNKIERTQVHAFWVSEKQSQFAYNYLTGLSKLQRGDKVDILRDALITGLLIHHVEPRMINLVKAYQEDLTLAHIVGFIKRIDPSLTEHEQPQSNITQMPLDSALTKKLDDITLLLNAFLTKSGNLQPTTELPNLKPDQLVVMSEDKGDNQELLETSAELGSNSTKTETLQTATGNELTKNSPNFSENEQLSKPEKLQSVKKNPNKVNKRVSNLSA